MSATSRIEYSEKYADEHHEYRYVLRATATDGQKLIFVLYRKKCLQRTISITTSHVILPKELAKTLPKSRLLTENEWRGIGVQQSRGWQHYALHRYVFLYVGLVMPRLQ
jgi:Cyclin-dependent kinase regulatory subunit